MRHTAFLLMLTLLAAGVAAGCEHVASDVEPDGPFGMPQGTWEIFKLGLTVFATIVAAAIGKVIETWLERKWGYRAKVKGQAVRAKDACKRAVGRG